MSKYIRLSENYNNNILISQKDSPYKYVTDQNKPYFTSMATYTEEQFNRWKTTNSLQGITNSVTNKLWADFDTESDLKDAFKDGLEFVERLMLLGIEETAIQISFTGAKGIGVMVDFNEEFNISQIKQLCFAIGSGLKTFDKVVYDNQRIIRLNLTKNEKSGLFKIPLTIEELRLADISQVKQDAQTNTGYNVYYTVSAVTHKMKEKMKPMASELKIVKNEPAVHVDTTHKPANWKNCKWSLLQGNFAAGERNNALMVITSTAKGLGYDKTTAYYLAKSASKKQASKTGQEEFDKFELYKNIIEVVYSDRWNGGQYTCSQEGWLKDYCESLDHPCRHQEEELKDASPKKIDEVHPLFKDFVLNIEKNTIKTGLERLDKMIPITVGMNLGVVAAPGVGKTSYVLDVLKNTSKQGITSVFASLDMHRTRIFEKLMYKMSGGMKREALYQLFKEDKEKPLLDKLKENYGNVYFYDRSSPSVKDIRAYIERVNAVSAEPVKLVVIDYFERINSEKNEETAASKDVAGQLQDLVNDFNVALITLVQPNKMSINGGPDTPILSYTAIKGSSFLYQSFRGIVSMWRPFFTAEHKAKDKYIQFGILKNDLGELGVLDYVFEGATGTIREFASEEEHQQLQFWLKEKENAKKGQGWD